MKQTRESKIAWAKLPRLEKSVFSFEHFRPLLAFLDKTLPKSSHVALMGGGKGHLAELLSNQKGGLGKLFQRRTFVITDIAEVENPFAPVMISDFEQPLPDMRKKGRELSALAAFSLEYGDISLATSNIADMLHPGETFIFVCHHSDSPYLVTIKLDKELFELINAAIKNLRRASREEWLWRCKGLEPQIRRIFSDRGESQTFPDFGPISECDEQTFRRYQRFQQQAEDALSIGMHAVLTLRQGYQNYHSPLTVQTILGSFSQYWDALKEHVEAKEPLLKKNIRNPPDLTSLVDERFKVSDGVIIAAKKEEKSKPELYCFAFAFKKQ